MQDALPALVLHSEALPRGPMNEAPTSSPSDAAPVGSKATDEGLMLDFTLGSAEAFSELFHRYKQPIYGFFRRRVADAAHAEELTQETFVALFRAASRYQPRALFRTYLYAIGFQLLRADRRRAAFRAMLLGKPKHAADPAKPDATESNLWVRRAVEKLEPFDREVLLLREFQQLSYAEIADLLRLPLNTVRSRLFRARTALRDLLDPSAASSESDAKQSASRAEPRNAAQAIHEKGFRL